MYIPLIVGGISLLQMLIGQIAKWRELALRTKEMTPEEDAAYGEKLKQIFAQPHWQLKQS